MLHSARILPLLCVSVLATLAASCTHAAQADAHEASTLVRYAELPARLCLTLDAETIAATARGDTRLWLQLRNRTPASKYSPAFQLMLVGNGGRRLLESFGMQVDHVERGNAGPQRFLFDVSDAELAPDVDGKVCFEVERDGNANDAVNTDAQLEIAIRWQSIHASVP